MFHELFYLMQAYKRKFHYPRYIFITFPWYVSKKWWIPDAPSSNCTVEERESALQYSLAAASSELPREHANYVTAENMVGVYIQVEKPYLWNEGGCRESPHEREGEQEDAWAKKECHSTPSIHLCLCCLVVLYTYWTFGHNTYIIRYRLLKESIM